MSDADPAIPPIDLSAGHRYFSADYFNRVWDYLGQATRTPEEDRRMVAMCHASIAHWLDRDDCGRQQLSIGYWQLSRVYSVLGNGSAAEEYAQLCLDASEGEGAFYLGFAYEALCRALKISGEGERAAGEMGKAREQLALVEDPGEREMLKSDLDSLETIEL